MSKKVFTEEKWKNCNKMNKGKLHKQIHDILVEEGLDETIIKIEIDNEVVYEK